MAESPTINTIPLAYFILLNNPIKIIECSRNLICLKSSDSTHKLSVHAHPDGLHATHLPIDLLKIVT